MPKCVSEIMTEDVLAVLPDESIREVAVKMNDFGVGSALVQEDSRLLGIVTERDYLKCVPDMTDDFLESPVSDIMTEKYVFLAPTASIEKAERLMRKGHFRHLPIMENDTLLGVVSSKDIFAAFHNEETIKSKQLEAVKKMIVTYAHELNNPLAIILGHLQQLKGQTEDVAVDRLLSDAKRIVQVVKDIQALDSVDEQEYIGSTKMFKVPHRG